MKEMWEIDSLNTKFPTENNQQHTFNGEKKKDWWQKYYLTVIVKKKLNNHFKILIAEKSKSYFCKGNIISINIIS